MNRWAAVAGLLGILGCNTVDQGENFVPPNLQLSEDFFYCQIQPRVIAAGTCASGAMGEAGSCHSSKSPLRLDPDGETAVPPECTPDNVVTGPVAPSYVDNYDSLLYTVQNDPLNSPIYRKMTGHDGHPRTIFPEGSAEADLIIEWITMGGAM